MSGSRRAALAGSSAEDASFIDAVLTADGALDFDIAPSLHLVDLADLATSLRILPPPAAGALPPAAQQQQHHQHASAGGVTVRSAGDVQQSAGGSGGHGALDAASMQARSFSDPTPQQSAEATAQQAYADQLHMAGRGAPMCGDYRAEIGAGGQPQPGFNQPFELRGLQPQFQQPYLQQPPYGGVSPAGSGDPYFQLRGGHGSQSSPLNTPQLDHHQQPQQQPQWYRQLDSRYDILARGSLPTPDGMQQLLGAAMQGVRFPDGAALASPFAVGPHAASFPTDPQRELRAFSAAAPDFFGAMQQPGSYAAAPLQFGNVPRAVLVSSGNGGGSGNGPPQAQQAFLGVGQSSSSSGGASHESQQASYPSLAIEGGGSWCSPLDVGQSLGSPTHSKVASLGGSSAGGLPLSQPGSGLSQPGAAVAATTMPPLPPPSPPPEQQREPQQGQSKAQQQRQSAAKAASAQRLRAGPSKAAPAGRGRRKQAMLSLNSQPPPLAPAAALLGAVPAGASAEAAGGADSEAAAKALRRHTMVREKNRRAQANARRRKKASSLPCAAGHAA